MLKPGLKAQLASDVCIYIFTVSAALVGACLTTLGIIHVVISLRDINTIVDDLLAVDTLLFLFACLFSYWALRARGPRRLRRLERAADVLFIAGLTLMAAICVIIVYAIGQSRGITSS